MSSTLASAADAGDASGAAVHDGFGTGRPVTLDAGQLARLHGLDPSGNSRLLARVAAAYAASAARLMPQLRTARDTGDWKRVAYVAHTLKSSSAALGALDFAARCAEVETMIAEGRVDGLGPPLDAFGPELELVLKAVSTVGSDPS